MSELVFNVAAFLLAHLPEAVLRGLAAALGDFVFFALPHRRRLILSNLHHAFPQQPASWHHAIGRTSCRRLVETGLLSLALPRLSARRLRSIVRAAPSLGDALAGHRPAVFATAHLCCWECETVLPLLVAPPFPEFAVIYRPLDHAGADAWMKHTRERFGMRMLSRREGFQEAIRILRRRGCVGLLFDQNAGMQGALTLLFDRVCSTSELAGLLAGKFGAGVHVLYPRRTGFWRIELAAHLIAPVGSSDVAGVTLAMNRWLESHLRADDDACASWLWAHDRWRHQDVPRRRLRLESRRDLLEEDLRQRGGGTLPRRLRLWIRLPNWLGDVVMTLPLLRALRRSRPDAEITVIVRAQFRPLLELAGAADVISPLPPRGPGYFRHFRRLRHEYPDCYLVFTHSWRGDLEARLTGCPQRFGLARAGRRRYLLSHRWRPPRGSEQPEHHQFRLWEQFLRHFGLAAEPDLSPLRLPSAEAQPDPPHIGLICGSEHDPSKRWPVRHWRELIGRVAAGHPDARFCLLGTAGDRPVADAVRMGLAAPVENLAGRTDLAAFARRLAACRLLVTNDTGGMHLANALGVPVLALFGPTNPRRTGPIFEAPVRILQPPGCPPTGGASLSDLAPAAVMAALDPMLNAARHGASLSDRAGSGSG